MDNTERQLLLVINGTELQISPTTSSDTVINDKGERLSDIMTKYIPIQLTYSEYNDKVRNNQIELDKYYIVLGDTENVTISDSVISRNSTFSSKRIMEILAQSGGVSLNLLGPNTLSYKLLSNKWVQIGQIYTYRVISNIITNSSLIHVGLNDDLSDDNYNNQLNAVKSALINRIKQNEGYITIYAFGTKPNIDLDLEITVFN